MYILFCINYLTKWQWGRGEGKALKTLVENDRKWHLAPLSLTLSPLRREREFTPLGDKSVKLNAIAMTICFTKGDIELLRKRRFEATDSVCA